MRHVWEDDLDLVPVSFEPIDWSPRIKEMEPGDLGLPCQCPDCIIVRRIEAVFRAEQLNAAPYFWLGAEAA